MPSATAAGHVLSNLGPLTAVFTPAPSCAAQQTNVYVGPRRQPNLPGYYINCADLNVLGRNGCVPSGAALDAQNTTPGAKPINYLSPGLACPTGWTTAGVMARGGPTEGVFQKPSDFDELVATTSIGAIPNPAVNVLMGVLEAGETAVVCCPSSMVADGMYGNCYSILTSFPVSACIRSADKSGQVGFELTALSIYGTTATIRTFSYNTNIPITATRTTVFSSQDQTALQAATYVPMVTLINRGETLGGAPRPGGSARARVPWAFLVAMAMAVSTLT